MISTDLDECSCMVGKLNTTKAQSAPKKPVSWSRVNILKVGRQQLTNQWSIRRMLPSCVEVWKTELCSQRTERERVRECSWVETDAQTKHRSTLSCAVLLQRDRPKPVNCEGSAKQDVRSSQDPLWAQSEQVRASPGFLRKAGEAKAYRKEGGF